MRLVTRTIDELSIEDEPSFKHVELYDLLKRALKKDGFLFRVPEHDAKGMSWDRALFLNLTFWSATEPSDVLESETIPADVVAHAAWHHLTRRALEGHGSADALFLGESIASAFDLYLVGRLLGHAPDAQFLASQVPAMAEVAETAGLSEKAFTDLLEGIADDPDRAFEDLRELLFDAGTSLARCLTVDDAEVTLDRFSGHRFASLLHHYELSNWILYARAYAGDALGEDPGVRALDSELRAAPVALDLLEARWLSRLR